MFQKVQVSPIAGCSFHSILSKVCVSADRERVVLGTEDGLFVVEVTRDGEMFHLSALEEVGQTLVF